MPTSPTTPAKAVQTSIEEIASPSGTSTVSSSQYEVSPGSTYAETVSGDSGPATPVNHVGIAAQHNEHTSSKAELPIMEALTRLLSSTQIANVANIVQDTSSVQHDTASVSTNTERGGVAADIEKFEKGMSMDRDPFFIYRPGVTKARVSPRQDRLGKDVTAENAQGVYEQDACLFVANLNSEYSNEWLEYCVWKAFSPYGRVYVKVYRNVKDMPFAFCQYEDEVVARIAMQDMQGQIITDRPCRIEIANAPRKMYVHRRDGGLTRREIIVAILNDKLPMPPPLDQVSLPTVQEYRDYNLPRFGMWVHFHFFQDYHDACEVMRNDPVHCFYVIPKLRVEPPAYRAQPGPVTFDRFKPTLYTIGGPSVRAENKCALYLGNLPKETTLGDLEDIYRPFGHITYLNIYKRSNAIKKIQINEACVEFATELEMRAALAGTRGRRFKDGSPFVVRKMTDPGTSVELCTFHRPEEKRADDGHVERKRSLLTQLTPPIYPPHNPCQLDQTTPLGFSRVYMAYEWIKMGMVPAFPYVTTCIGVFYFYGYI